AARGARGFLAFVAAEQLDYLLAHATEVRAKLAQYLGCHAFAFADEAKQDVLGADVVVAKLQCLAQLQFEHVLRTCGERDVAGWCACAVADDLYYLLAHAVERSVQRAEYLGCNAFAFTDKAKQDVLSADVVVVEHAC